MRQRSARQMILVSICAAACGWPVVPLIGFFIRRTLAYVLLDAGIGVILGGVALVCVAAIEHKILCADALRDKSGVGLPAPKRVAVGGLLMAFFGAVWTIAESITRPALF